MKDTLLLNADHMPLQILDWQRAVWLVLTDRVRRVDDYRDLFVRSARLRVPWPAVVALGQYVPVDVGSIALSRSTLLARDGFACQYCGWQATTRQGRPVTEPLTVDHVVPRSQARGGLVQTRTGITVPVTSWENLVSACKACNHRKGPRTPWQANMPLRTVPRRPNPMDAVRIAFARVEVEREWVPFLPEGAGLARSREAA